MKRCLIYFAALTLLLISCACGTNGIKDIDIRKRDLIDTTEGYQLASYNGYKCSGYNIVKNEDDTYIVMLEFDKLENN